MGLGNQADIGEISKNFELEGQFLDAEPYGNGYINDTFVARFLRRDGRIQRTIIQRINHHVFKIPEHVMHNMALVIEHLQRKIVEAGGDPSREAIMIIPTTEGKNYYRSPSGDYWRGMKFIEGARSYIQGEGLDHYYQAASAFGKFIGMLSDFPANLLYETIPDFHNTPKRFDSFIKIVEYDPVNRAQAVQREIDFILKRADDAGALALLSESGLIPQRVVHNDTKIDNVLFDIESGQAICTIDLDTVMPGLVVYDFGDSVRTGANTAAEDERDLSKVSLDLGIFESLASGYLDEARDFLTSAEIDNLALGAKLITYEQSIRFLADHLEGDTYYKISRTNHNLDRCRSQIALVLGMERNFDQMTKIIDQYR